MAMQSNHLQLRRRRFVWFSIFSFSLLAVLFFRDHQDRVRHEPLASDSGNYYHQGDNPKFAIGSKVTNQELVQEASRLHQHQILNNRYQNNGGQALRYRIKKAHADQQPTLGSVHDMRSNNPTEQQQYQQHHGNGQGPASSIDLTLVKGGVETRKNSEDDEYDYFYAKPGSLRDKILLEDYGAAVFPQPKKGWKLWSLDSPRPPLPRPDNFPSPKKHTHDPDFQI